MSSIAEILDATTNLVAKIDELLQTDTVQALPEVAAELGIAEVFNQGVTALAELLRSLNTELARLDDAIEQLDGLGALLGLLQPLVGGLARMLGSGGQGLAEYGLAGPAGALGTVGEHVGYAERALGVASNLVIDASRFTALREQIEALANTVADLRVEPASESESETEGEAA